MRQIPWEEKWRLGFIGVKMALPYNAQAAYFSRSHFEKPREIVRAVPTARQQGLLQQKLTKAIKKVGNSLWIKRSIAVYRKPCCDVDFKCSCLWDSQHATWTLCLVSIKSLSSWRVFLYSSHRESRARCEDIVSEFALLLLSTNSEDHSWSLSPSRSRMKPDNPKLSEAF